jgi:hypothetical protein
MTINATEPLHQQYNAMAAVAPSLLNRLTAATARNDFHTAESILYELNHMVELGLRVMKPRTEIQDAPFGAEATVNKGVWNPQDGTRVLPGVEFMQNGDFYQCTVDYRQFAKNDKLVAWSGVWYRIGN